MQHSKQLIVIEGPTASGKTALGIALAKHWNTCILSADSRQFYRELAIGTAKPSREEQDDVLHYFINSHDLKDEVSAARYAREALAILEKEFEQHAKIVMVGGSGMFIDAVCIGLDEIPTDAIIKQQVTEQWNAEGLDFLLEELRKKDPIYFEEVDASNPMRIIRAIEAMRITGQTFSSLRTNSQKERLFEVKRFVIDHPREVLYARINQRVDQMILQGLINEAKAVHPLKNLGTLRTVGYSELFDYFEGSITLERAIELIKQNTRRYAKRQLTWFRRHPDAVWISATETHHMADHIYAQL